MGLAHIVGLLSADYRSRDPLTLDFVLREPLDVQGGNCTLFSCNCSGRSREPLEKQNLTKAPPYRPNPEQTALWPSVSGNTINGLGEANFRRPEYIYWRSPDEISFGPLQRWFYKQNTAPELTAGRAERMEEERVPLVTISDETEVKSPEEWARSIKETAQGLGVEAVGITAVNPDWFYEGASLPYKTIIVLGLAMDYDQMTAAPDISAGAHVVGEYTRGMKASKRLADWIRSQGHDAYPEHGPFAGELPLIPAALAAGLGELGKHGSVINAELGSCFRLASVLTNLEIKHDVPIDFGADSFCLNCKICSNHCPPDAIRPQKDWVRGTQKWYVDFDKCLPFFNETAGCGICVTVCPFSRPGVGENLVAKLARRL
ncbi:MAG: epoxyqueuosine reductase [Ascidiaceihabitans sp.]